MAEDNARLNEKRGRIAFRAWRRGFREADLVLGPFVEREGPSLTETELDELEALLNIDDQYLYAWIIGREPTPAEHETPLMARIRAFMRDHVAAVVAQGAG